MKYFFDKSAAPELTEYLKIYTFYNGEKSWKIAFTEKKANSRTRIHCMNNEIIWEQVIPNGHAPIYEKTVICQPSSFMEKDKISVLVISGSPDIICGLDEGRIASAKQAENNGFDSGKLYVMSEKAFKALQI